MSDQFSASAETTCAATGNAISSPASVGLLSHVVSLERPTTFRSGPVAGPVSPFHQREASAARKTTAISGRSCSALLHPRDPLGSLVKTLLASPTWNSTERSLTWRALATPRGRLAFQLVPSTPRTSDVGGWVVARSMGDADRAPENADPAPRASRRTARQPDLRHGPWSFFDRVQCSDSKDRRAQPGADLLVHGLPADLDQLCAFGDAVVPQVAAQFVSAMLEWRPT